MLRINSKSAICLLRQMSTSSKRPSELLDKFIRVDHAGELGADRIYAGQMAVLGNSKMGPTIQHVRVEYLVITSLNFSPEFLFKMWDQEKVHRHEMENLIKKHRVRPTILTPLWNIAGFALGAGTALLGEKAAMACRFLRMM